METGLRIGKDFWLASGNIDVMRDCVDSFVDDLVRNWDSFGNNLKYLIQRDLEKNFAQDDIDRREGRGVCRLGHDCDRLSWERVRKLYFVGDEK